MAKCDVFEKDMYQNILEEKLEWITDCFEKIIDMLIQFNMDNLSPSNNLKEYLDNRCTGWSVSNAIELAKPMFRARKIGKYERNIHELYHIPFTKRSLLSDERFSSVKKPMLYLAETIEGTLHETHLKFEEANYALFVPKFSNFYRRISYNINNSMQTSLDNVCLHEQNTMIKYDNRYFTFSKRNITGYLAEFILYQILLFPVYDECKDKTSRCPQYILPQTIMEIVSEKNMYSIIYHSANKISNRGYDKYKNQHDKNICLNVPYAEEYNEQYLENFFTAMWFQGDMRRTTREARELQKECVEIARPHQDEFVMNDYTGYLVAIEMHLEYMEKIVMNYSLSMEGQVEATLFCDFMEQIKPILKEPEKYGVCRRK